MKTKTIALSGNDYRLNADNTIDNFQFTGKYENQRETDEGQSFGGDPIYEWVRTNYKLGAVGVLIAISNISTKNEWYKFVFDCPDGVPGNSNRNICRFHGWRGTSNDISVTALGARKITKIRTRKNGDISFTVGDDLNPHAK